MPRNLLTAGATGAATLTSLSVTNTVKLAGVIEIGSVSGSGATGALNFDLQFNSILYYTGASTGNWTINFRAQSGTALNDILVIGDSISCAFLATNTGLAFRPTSFTIDGAAATARWQGGVTPSGGNPSSVDVYSFTIIKTANATFTLLASQTRFA
jgi:hypothetical protein